MVLDIVVFKASLYSRPLITACLPTKQGRDAVAVPGA